MGPTVVSKPPGFHCLVNRLTGPDRFVIIAIESPEG